MNRWVLSALAFSGWIAFSGPIAFGEPAGALVQKVRMPEKLGTFNTSELLNSLQIIDRADRDEDGKPVGEGPLSANETGTHPLVLCVEEKADQKKNHRVYLVAVNVPEKHDSNPVRTFFRKIDVEVNGKPVEDAVFTLIVPGDEVKTISHRTLSLVEVRFKEAAKSYGLFYRTDKSTLVDVKLGMADVDSGKANFSCYVSPFVEAD